jgi:predicted lysophospholipase L1 biosynthesis ABC-type transport system permease subunit
MEVGRARRAGARDHGGGGGAHGRGFLVDRIGIAVDNQAGEVLAADLVLESAQPIDDAPSSRRRRAACVSRARRAC